MREASTLPSVFFIFFTVSHFEVERATDGKAFKVLVRVAGKGNSTELNSYGAYDQQPASGTNYYRLRQFDGNGQPADLGIRDVSFRLGAGAVLSVYPNPSRGPINLVFADPENREVMVRLTDMGGRMVHQEKIQLHPGRTNYPLNLKQRLVKGTCVVVVNGGRWNLRMKLMAE